MQRRWVGFPGVPDPGASRSLCLRLSAFRHHPPNAGFGPLTSPIQYRRATTRTGELDGAKEANGG
jgi:hypothetical protein